MEADFAAAVTHCLEQIPSGRVATCRAIARAFGDVRAAPAVATWLGEHPETPSGHRVVRADGRPVLDEADRGLRREGIHLASGRVDPARILGSLPDLEFLGPLRTEQRRLAAEVIEQDERGPINVVTGVDVSYRGDEMYAAAASVGVADLHTVEIAMVRKRVTFPYIPTFLAYREFPAIEAVVRRLGRQPDALLIDGHGRLHPALFGVACYAGIKLGMPTIGVAKHPLIGRVRSAPESDTTARPIVIDDIIRGYAWTPPGRARAIYISVGNRISLGHALALVRRTTRRGYPEALRIADRASRQMSRNEKREKGATQ